MCKTQTIYYVVLQFLSIDLLSHTILFQCYSIKSWKSCHDNISLGNKPWSRSSRLHLPIIRPRQRQCQSISGSNKTYLGEQEERGGLGLVSVRECISTGSFDVFEKCIRQMSTFIFFNSVLTRFLWSL